MSSGWLALIEIPRETPSGNVTRKEYWAKSYARQKLWQEELMVAMAEDRTIREGQPYDRVHIISVRRRKLDGFDNLPFGMKEIIPDNLKLAGLIIDDADDYCEITCEQRIVENGEKPKTYILLGKTNHKGETSWIKDLRKRLLGSKQEVKLPQVK